MARVVLARTRLAARGRIVDNVVLPRPQVTNSGSPQVTDGTNRASPLQQWVLFVAIVVVGWLVMWMISHAIDSAVNNICYQPDSTGAALC